MSGVLVTGGAGFIGSHVADALLARGHRVTVAPLIAESVDRPDACNQVLSPGRKLT